MSAHKRGPHGETIDQDGEVIAWPSRWRRLWAATDGIRLIWLAAIVALVGVLLMSHQYAS